MRLVLLFLMMWLLAPQAQAGERILALSPHACEILADIGAADEIVGVVDYCDFPESLSKLPNLGGYNRIQVEAAMKLKPTLAIVMNDGAPAVNKLRALGVRVEASNPVTIDAMLAEVERFGALSGHQHEAAQQVHLLRARLARLKPGHSQKSVKVFYEIWDDPLIAAGGSSLIHDVLTHLGLNNVFGAIAMEGPKVNIEAVVRAKPDLIIVAAGNEKVREQFWKKWLGERVRVIGVNADLLHRPTPRLIDGMEALAARLSAGGGLHE